MKKIMFNDKYALTDAVLQGRKTMTRRLVGNRMTEGDIKAYLKGYTELANKCAPYKIGEVVAVAQSYKSIFEESLNYLIPRYHWLDDHIDEKGYANKMFVKADLMPHQIRITDVKVERLQDISEEDCLREGVVKHTPSPIDENKPRFAYKVNKQGLAFEWFGTPQNTFAALIDKVSGKGTWNHNPYVFAYTFILVK